MIKYLTLIILIFSTIGLMYWLWQRQPRPKELETTQKEATAAANQLLKQEFITEPSDFGVLTSGNVIVKGKTNPNDLVAIYSNNFQYVLKANTEGQFTKEVQLETGLNLINVTTLSTKDKTQNQTLTLYFDKNTDNKNVFAGSVKNIFDTLLTLSTTAGERNARTAKSTDFDIPQDEDEKEATATGVKLVRIGDYAIALGNTTDSDTLLAQSVVILRDNKPQITEQFIRAKIISNVRQNLFSTKAEEDSKIIELTLAKTSKIQTDGKDGKTVDIAKDKNAFIFYYAESDKNIVDLIYLLP